jgi:hypothetical protein
VQSQISPLDLWAFLPPQQVSAIEEIAADPDTMCIKHNFEYAYDALFTWNFEVVPGAIGFGDHDIALRNADFKTP